MRRILATLTVLAAFLFGLPTTAHAAPAPLGGGSDLFTAGGPSGRCSASFAATGGAAGYLIAGPACPATVGTLLYSGNQVLVGPVASAQNGVVLVEVTNTTDWELVSWVPFGGIDVAIRGSAEAPVGGTVCLISRTTGKSCGSITAKNQTVHFPEGSLTGLTRTTICLEPGGVAFISGDQAQGVPIGGGGCVSYFRPINQVLATYGLALLTG
jgi:streptogrisin C